MESVEAVIIRGKAKGSFLRFQRAQVATHEATKEQEQLRVQDCMRLHFPGQGRENGMSTKS
eukprot:1161131-Pelagomonas_calceolata.AAC.12